MSGASSTKFDRATCLTADDLDTSKMLECLKKAEDCMSSVINNDDNWRRVSEDRAIYLKRTLYPLLERIKSISSDIVTHGIESKIPVFEFELGIADVIETFLSVFSGENIFSLDNFKLIDVSLTQARQDASSKVHIFLQVN